jgi:hypothetical protein
MWHHVLASFVVYLLLVYYVFKTATEIQTPAHQSVNGDNIHSFFHLRALSVMRDILSDCN